MQLSMSSLQCISLPYLSAPLMLSATTSSSPSYALLLSASSFFTMSHRPFSVVVAVLAIAFTGGHCKPTIQKLDIQHHNPKFPIKTSSSSSKKFDGSSSPVDLSYHMGPVLSSTINLYLIWYGKWEAAHQQIIKDFLHSFSASPRLVSPPSVADWWRTVTLYTDQTGANVSRTVYLSGEYADRNYSQGISLTRLSIQNVIASSVRSAPFPVKHRNGLFLVLSSEEVTVQDFCRAVCGFHYFTFPSVVGFTLPYVWVGNSGEQCPGLCSFPFVIPEYMKGGGRKPLSAPNSVPGVDGMLSILGHELAEVSSNPLINAWYAGDDPSAPTEIADLCQGIYGSGGGSGFIGQVMKDAYGRTFNLNGLRNRKFLVQWIWNPTINTCSGPNEIR